MNPKRLSAIVATAVVITTSLGTPASAFPASWRLLDALFTGGTPAIGRPRSANLINTPYIITPRKTAVTDSAPDFKWHPVPNIASYRVTLRGPSGILWETLVQGSEIEYIGTPRLNAGVRYSLIVKTETYRDSNGFATEIAPEDVSSSRASFYMLPETEQIQLNEELIAAAGQGLTPLAIGIRQARIYRDHNLMGHAISLLESLKAEAIDSVVLHRLLGEMYLQVELSTYAHSAFTQARSVALETGSLSGQADASVFLAHIAIGNRNPEKATEFLEEAYGLYQAIGDGVKAQAVADWLAAL